MKFTAPKISQSPAVREIDVTFAAVLLVRETPDPEAITLEMHCPTTPAAPFTPLVIPLIVGVLRVAEEVTKAVVANWVVLVPAPAVGAAGVPVKVGEARGAYIEAAVAVVRYPEIEAPPGIVTVPVKVGEANGA